MKLESFTPSEYTSPCGTIRVRRAGDTWTAETLEEMCADRPCDEPYAAVVIARHWEPLAGCEASTAEGTIARALELLGLAEEEGEPHPIAWPDAGDDCGF